MGQLAHTKLAHRFCQQPWGGQAMSTAPVYTRTLGAWQGLQRQTLSMGVGQALGPQRAALGLPHGELRGVRRLGEAPMLP